MQYARISNFEISQRSGTTESTILPRCDALLTVAGYEPRSTNIINASHEGSSTTFIIRFLSDTTDLDKDQNQNSLSSWAEAHSDQVTVLTGFKSVEINAGFDTLSDAIFGLYKRTGKPLHVGIDISSLPKSYLMFIIGFGFRSGVIGKLFLFYSVGIYPETVLANRSQDELSQHSFTGGEWTSALIPYLEGKLQPGRTRKAIISLGFDAPQIGKFLERYDPDTLRVVLPNPGFKDVYSKKVQDELNLLRRIYSISTDQIREIAAGDVIGCLNIMRELAEEDGFQEKLLLPFGPKTHAISCALTGLTVDGVSVVSRIPNRYMRLMTKASGVALSYSVRDLTALF